MFGLKVADARDAIVEIKKRAVTHQFDVLLVFMFDRLGRREDETPFVVQWFAQQGIEVWSTREGEQRFDTHVDKLLNYIRFWQASGESEKTSIRVKTKHAQMVQEGLYRVAIFYSYKLETRTPEQEEQTCQNLVVDEEKRLSSGRSSICLWTRDTVQTALHSTSMLAASKRSAERASGEVPPSEP